MVDIACAGRCAVSACCSVGTLAQPAAPQTAAAISHTIGEEESHTAAKLSASRAGSVTSSGLGP